MIIQYEIDDGYAGGSAPQTCRIDDNEILEFETLDEALKFIDEMIHEDFLQKATPTWDHAEVQLQVQKLRKTIQS